MSSLASRLVSVAIPDSLFIDEETLRGKTTKVGQIARAASIFGVERIYIYRDSSKNYDREFETAKDILEYLETPQYLRRRLIPRKSNLEFAGILPPLRIPSHMRESVPRQDEIREAVLTTQNGELVADVGAKEAAIFEGRGQHGQRITVKVVSLKPLKVAPSPRPEQAYWGYEVRRAPSLARFLRSANFDLTILTSRLGELASKKWSELSSRMSSSERALVCFGSPEAGVDKMLKQDNAEVRDFPKAMYLNLFPFQRVETVRLEEALLGSLSVLNIAANV